MISLNQASPFKRMKRKKEWVTGDKRKRKNFARRSESITQREASLASSMDDIGKCRDSNLSRFLSVESINMPLSPWIMSRADGTAGRIRAQNQPG